MYSTLVYKTIPQCNNFELNGNRQGGNGKRVGETKRDYTFDPRLFINLTESLSTDTGKYVTIHSRNKSHTEVAERLGLSFDTTQVLRLASVYNFGTCCVLIGRMKRGNT